MSEVLNSVYSGGKVIGEFVCDEIYVRPANVIYYGKGQEDYLDLLKSACMTEREVLDYMGGQFNRDTYFWHVTDLKIYDKPRDITEFALYGKCAEDCDEYDICARDSEDGRMSCKYFKRTFLKRPPQSWVYCETIDER